MNCEHPSDYVVPLSGDGRMCAVCQAHVAYPSEPVASIAQVKGGQVMTDSTRIGPVSTMSPVASVDLGSAFTRPADAPLGVTWQGPWDRIGDGFCEHVRRCARALALVGCPVHLRAFSAVTNALGMYGPEGDAALATIKDLVTPSFSRATTQVMQMVATHELLDSVTRPTPRSRLTDEEFAGVMRLRTIYTVWERDPIPAWAATALQRAGQAWVASSVDALRLRSAGVERVHVIPVPFFPDDPHLALRGRNRTPGPVRFYAIGKWEPRKALHELIGVFLRTFKPSEAELHLKTSKGWPGLDRRLWKYDDKRRSLYETEWPTYPETPMGSVFEWLKDPAVCAKGWDLVTTPRWLRIYSGQMASEQIVALHGKCDVYVSLARGEGFDMNALDAKLAGNQMVYVPSGAHDGMATLKDVSVPVTGHVTCHGAYGWADATYYDYNAVDAGDALRRMANRGHYSDDADMTQFEARHVGEKIVACLHEMLGGRPW